MLLTFYFSGPVNMSIQMLRAESSDCELQIGGSILPMIVNSGNVYDNDEKMSSAQLSDEAIYYGGDVIRAAQAVIDKEMRSGEYLHSLVLHEIISISSKTLVFRINKNPFHSLLAVLVGKAASW